MWVNKELFERTLRDNMCKMNEIAVLNHDLVVANTAVLEIRMQKAKDDITIDWMRHQVNSLSSKETFRLISRPSDAVRAISRPRLAVRLMLSDNSMSGL